MTDNEYLKNILDAQTLKEDSQELKDLRKHREDVEELLREQFAASSPTIRYGGSKAKGTMIKDAYDLDVICYFENDDTAAGETLKDIYGNVKAALAPTYVIEEKPSALRLKGCDKGNPDFHIDVVPGRFTDDDREDAFLYRKSADKGRQKTNLQKHIDHVVESGVGDAIRLLKLWRSQHGLAVRHFILELLTIKLLKGKSGKSLVDQLTHVWTDLRDNIDDLSIEDPANPTGNDLSELLDDAIRNELSAVAADMLSTIETQGWRSVFGPVAEETKAAPTRDQRREIIREAPSITVAAPRPWASGEDA
jgi:hypothetical protein